jgi:hypothetical protein
MSHHTEEIGFRQLVLLTGLVLGRVQEVEYLEMCQIIWVQEVTLAQLAELTSI